MRMFVRIAAKCVTLQVGSKALNHKYIYNVHEKDISTVKYVCGLELAGRSALAAFPRCQVAEDIAPVMPGFSHV